MVDGRHRTGRQGEVRAANFLRAQRYQILERNYRFARGEIDIIAERDDVLVFVEVKTATTRAFGEPETWVTEAKQKQIGMVAERYLQDREIEDKDCRFDVIAVQMSHGSSELKHIENAFWI